MTTSGLGAVAVSGRGSDSRACSNFWPKTGTTDWNGWFAVGDNALFLAIRSLESAPDRKTVRAPWFVTGADDRVWSNFWREPGISDRSAVPGTMEHGNPLPSPSMVLEVSLVGHVGLANDGTEVAGTALGRLGRIALAYLVSERQRPVPHGELADVLWGQDLPRSWEQLVRGTIAKLRAAFREIGLPPTEVVTTKFGCYELHLPPGTRVDVDIAAAATEAAMAALSAGDAEQALAEANVAIPITSQQFVPGGAGLWVEARQAELRELQLHALEIRADAAIATHRFDRAIEAAETVVSFEPFRESAYQRLIAAHAAAGHRGEALRAYERCRRALREELGVSPSPVIEALYVELLGTEPPTPADAARDATPIPLPLALAPIQGSFFVGRTAEQGVLQRAFDRAAFEGRQAVFVAGEPGAGKTSLVAEVARRAHAAGAIVLYGRCDEDLGLAYQPFAEALGVYLAHAPLGALVDHVRVWGGELLRLTPELGRRLPDTPVPSATDPEEDRFRLFQATAAVLESAASSAPLVLVLDDLQWAPLPTVFLLRHVLRSSAQAPLLLIATYRHTELSGNSPLKAALADLRREPAVERITLEGLDRAAVEEFLARTIGGGNAHGETLAAASAIHAHTGGNPFFVGELARHLMESGAVYRKEQSWSYYADPSGDGIPHGVRDVVGRRLGRLSDRANRVLVIGAIVGLEFDLRVVERAVGRSETDSDQALDAVEEAVAAHLASEIDFGRYRFAHALVRDCIYADLSSTRRERLHFAVAEALEAVAGDDPTSAAVLAHHYVAATSAGGAAKAATYALVAAREALGRAAWEEAIEGLERALEALDHAPAPDLERRYDLLVLLAEIWHRHFDARSALTAAQAAVDTARELDSPELLGRAALWYLYAAADVRGPDRDAALREGLSLAEEVLPALGDSDLGLRATLLALLAGLARHRLLSDEAAGETIQEALDLARRSGDPIALAQALIASCAALRGSPRIQEHIACAEELASAEVDEHDRLAGYWHRAMGRLAAGDRNGFEADFRLLKERGTQRRAVAPPVAAWPVTVALLDGRFAEAEARLAARAEGGAGEGPFDRELRLRQQARVYYEMGDFERAAEAADSLIVEWGDNPMHIACRLLLRSERRELERFADAAPAPMAPERQPVVHAYRAEVVAALGGADRARRQYEAFLPWQGQLVIGGLGEAPMGAVDRFLGMLAATAESWEDAEDHFRAAEALEERLAAPPLLARTHYWHARMLGMQPDVPDKRSAMTLVERAAASTLRLGMAALHRQASALRAALG